jgi:ADP-heptose:LPS heptosyltransferase
VTGDADPQRLLLIQLVKMGDVLLCTPAIRAARAAFPDARIEFLTDAVGADALGSNPHLDEILVYRRGLRHEWRTLQEVRRRAYDAVADFHSVPRTARVVLASAAPRRIGVRGRGPRNLAYTELLPKVRESVYIPRQKLRVLAALGVDTGPGVDLSLEIVTGSTEREFAQRLWKEHGLAGGEPVVAISPVAHEPLKQWGAERWAAVGDALAASGAQVLITSGPGEREQAAGVAERMSAPAVWDYGRTTIRELAALYRRCVLWVGNDGGPKHVAVAAGAPTLTVIRYPLGPIWTHDGAAVPHRYVQRRPTGVAEGARMTPELEAHSLRAVHPAGVLDAALSMLRGLQAEALSQPALDEPT